jgi:transcriptional regulator with XRE-family HTH domain
MGGPGSGRRPNLARWRKAVQLRARGLTLAAIGRRLGLTRQGTAYILANTARRLPRVPDRCGDCGRELSDGGTADPTGGKVYCPDCLRRLGGTDFAQRLRYLRVRRGMTRVALERAAGVGRGLVRHCEEGGRLPKPETLARLLRVLGPELTGGEGKPTARYRGHP